jgi:hypothetical protein
MVAAMAEVGDWAVISEQTAFGKPENTSPIEVRAT